MSINDFLRKSGIMRSGTYAGTYKNGKDRPTELMMDDVYNAKKDLVTNNEPGEKSPEPAKGTARRDEVTPPSEPSKAEPPSSGEKPAKKPMPKWLKISLIVGGVFVALIVLAVIFGKPTAESVFNDSLDEMLQTESVVVEHEFTGKGAGGESIKMTSSSYIEMLENDDLKAKGTFDVDITSGGVPITAKAEFVAVDGGKYIKFAKLASSDAKYSAAFSQVESKIDDKWIKAREGDNFATFVDVPVDVLTSVTALPYGNLNDEAREKVVAILQDEDAFTIVESAEVEVGGKSAYRYELEFNEDKQDEMAKALGDAVGYFKSDDDGDSTKIEKLELWVDISTKRYIKMEFKGVSKQGAISATVKYSGYGEKQDVSKPDEYFIESELVQ